MARAAVSARARLTREYIADQVVTWFSDHFYLPKDYFPEDTNLRKKLLFDSKALVELGKEFNEASWTPVQLYPEQYAKCKTIGDIIDLIYKYS